MEKYDITILTESRYENISNLNGHGQNVYTEDKLVQEALERKGLKVNRVDWATKTFD